MERDPETPQQPSYIEQPGQPATPAQSWQPAPSAFLGQSQTPGAPPAYAPPQQPAPPFANAPMNATSNQPGGPLPWSPAYSPKPEYPAAPPPKWQQMWQDKNVRISAAVAALALLVILFVAPGLLRSHAHRHVGPGHATSTPTRPHATNTPAPSFPLANSSSNMQMGTGYVEGSPPQITGQTSDFRTSDPYAVLLNISPNTLGVDQVNFVLLRRNANNTDTTLLSRAESVQSNWATVLWHDASISRLMGSEPPGQYEIRITDQQGYFGYVDFNYHG